MATAAPDGDRLLGFVLAMAECIDYDSANYLWFSARYPRFRYVDRVVVAAAGRGAFADPETLAALAGQGHGDDDDPDDPDDQGWLAQ